MFLPDFVSACHDIGRARRTGVLDVKAGEPVPAASPPPSAHVKAARLDAEQAYLAGMRHLADGEWPAAVRALRRAATLYPDVCEYDVAVAWAEFRVGDGEGDWRDRRARLKTLALRALGEDATMPLPHHALGHVLAIEGDDAGAIRELRAALRLEPGKLESRRQLQVLERRSRLRSDQARTGVGSAARKGHATAAARTLEHATVARSSGQLDLAERLLREALHTTPDAPELAAELALTLLRRDPAHNARESNTLARAARQSDPKLPLPWVVLGMLLAQIGHVERALQMFRHALELDPECVEAQQELERPRP